MLCTQCGAPLNAQSHFCPNCGHKVAENPSEQPSTAVPTESKKMPLWFKAIIALTALGIIGGSFIALMQEDATDVVKQQLNALKEDHLTEAYYNYTSKGFREATSLEQFKDFVKGHSAFIKNSSVEFLERSIHDNEGVLEASLSSVNGITTHIDFQMIREGDKWKILSIRIEDVATPHPTPQTDQNVRDEKRQQTSDVEETPLLSPIKEQLQAFKAGDLSGSYKNVVSKKFAENTPQDKFEDYVKSHPILFNYISIKYSDIKQRNHSGSAKATLTSPQGTVTIDYELFEDGNTWKIWSLHLEEEPSSDQTNDEGSISEDQIDGFNAAPLFDSIKKQLEDIRQQDLSKAYFEFTSEDFKKSTPQKDFEAFVKGQPALSFNTGVKFRNLSFDNNIANISGTLQTKDGKNYPVEYSLVLENDIWKIVHIQIQPPTKPQTRQSASAADDHAQAIKFTKFVLGTETDAQGIVLDPGKAFKVNSGDLYLNLYIINGSPGTKIEVLFTHIDSKSSIAPVSTTLSEHGETILSFVFSPPKQGWPTGIYRIQATSSAGEKDSFNFKVN
jgi:hypothetical protein